LSCLRRLALQEVPLRRQGSARHNHRRRGALVRRGRPRDLAGAEEAAVATLTKFASTEPFPMPRRRKARPALFNGYWLTREGRRLERATREELREAARLYWRHKDIRLGWKRVA
jgi:hypothetical protein